MSTTATIFELVRRCRHCRREMTCEAPEYNQNPFCRICLPQRIAKEAGPQKPIWAAADATKMRVRVR